MFSRLLTTVLPAAFFTISVAQTYELASQNGRPRAKAMLQREICARDKGSDHGPYLGSWTNLLSGVLQSTSFTQYAGEIPCDIVHTLMHDPQKAEDLVDDICRDDVTASIIKDLRKPIQDAFSNIIIIAFKLPSTTRKKAEATIAGATEFINKIESGQPPDMDKISEEAGSYITSLLSSFNAGLPKSRDTATNVPTCSVVRSIITKNRLTSKVVATIDSSKKPSSTRVFPHHSSIPKITAPNGPANSSVPTTGLSNISRSFASMPSATLGGQTPNLGARISSYSFDSTSIVIWAVTILSVFGVAIFF